MSNKTTKFAFILGREQKLALEELKAVLSRFGFCFDIYKITRNVVFAKLPDLSDEDISSLISTLAGTIKIYRMVGKAEKNLISQLADLIKKLRGNSTGKINFGISYFGEGFSGQHINSIALSVKRSLKDELSLRYVDPKNKSELSSILSLKNKMVDRGIEFGLFDYLLGVLVALNNPEDWSKRDYDKPAFDKYSGMVPPKLARMMVNLTLSYNLTETNGSNLISGAGNTKYHNDCIVADPFCGSGNILMEAMMLGCGIIGSDISEKAINDTKKNLKWLETNYQLLTTKQNIFQLDATSDSLIKEWSHNNHFVIVTEPYLGAPKKFKTTMSAVVGEYTKVKTLYLNFLKNIAALSPFALKNLSKNKIQKSKDQNLRFRINNNENITLCLVFPLIETSDRGRFSLFSFCVDELKRLGYTQIRPSFVYGRDYQIVKREIIWLRFKNPINKL